MLIYPLGYICLGKSGRGETGIHDSLRSCWSSDRGSSNLPVRKFWQSLVKSQQFAGDFKLATVNRKLVKSKKEIA